MKHPKVLVIDAGLGNIGSVVASFERQDCQIFTYDSPDKIDSLDLISHVILPGVGSFAKGMSALRERGWDHWIKNEWRQIDRPLLGICLGMQLLASKGQEGASQGCLTSGLDQIPGVVNRLETSFNLPLPHIGWNEVIWQKENQSLIAANLPNNGDFYFVHSYVFDVYNQAHALAKTSYGSTFFTSVVSNGLCFGTQFHPEKSQRLGKRFISNFLNF